MKRLRHDESLFATKGLLIVRLPCVEDIPCVRQEKTVVFGLGAFQNLKELVSDLRCSRDTFVCWASEDKENIFAFFDQNLVLLIAIATAGLYLGEHILVIGLSAAIENADDVAIVFLA